MGTIDQYDDRSGYQSGYDDHHRYDDIINLPRPVSLDHPRMSVRERAAQFAPFAALSGHGEAVKETERYTQERIEPDEAMLALLDARLQIVQEYIHTQPTVTFVYFEPDAGKAGGTYVSVTGSVKQIDRYRHCIVLSDGKEIPVDEIVKMEGEIFTANLNRIH